MRKECSEGACTPFGAGETKMPFKPISSPNKSRSSEHIKLSEEKAKCPLCKENKVRKKGFRKTKHRGQQQRWFCNKCNKAFTVDNGFWKMKFNEKKIAQAIDTYFEGLSLRKVRRNFVKYSELYVSHQSVLNWIRKYSYLIRNYVKRLHPQLSGHYVTDETMIKCAGKYHYFGAVMDKHSRYVVATKYTEHDHISVKDTVALWKSAKEVQHPRKISTDGHHSYKQAYNKVFYTRYKEGHVEWNEINHSRTGQFNYKIERLWNTFKERIKVMRGFKVSWSAKLLIDGFFLWYNFVRPHMSLGNKKPYEMVGLQNMSYLELIKLAVKL